MNNIGENENIVHEITGKIYVTTGFRYV